MNGKTSRINKDESETSDAVYFRKCFTFLFALSAYAYKCILLPTSLPFLTLFSEFFSSLFLSATLTIIVCYISKWYRLEWTHTYHGNGLHHSIGWIYFKSSCVCAHLCILSICSECVACTKCIYDVNARHQISQPVEFHSVQTKATVAQWEVNQRTK